MTQPQYPQQQPAQQFAQPQYPQQQMQQPAMTAAQLFADAAADVPINSVEGKYRFRCDGFEWHVTDNDKALGLAHNPNVGMPKLRFTCLEIGSNQGKEYNNYFSLSKGVSARTGRAYNMEREVLKFLSKHGMNESNIGLGDIPAVFQVVTDPYSGVKSNRDTYSPIFKYLADFGGEYVIEFKKKKNSEELNAYFREVPTLFNEDGTAVPRPNILPSAGTQVPVQQDVPVQQAPVQQIPVEQPPVQQQVPPQQEIPQQLPPQQAPVAQEIPAQAPVQQQVPPQGAPAGIPQNVPQQQVPVQNAVPPQQVPPQQSIPTGVPPQQSIPAGVPAGIPAGVPAGVPMGAPAGIPPQQ